MNFAPLKKILKKKFGGEGSQTVEERTAPQRQESKKVVARHPDTAHNGGEKGSPKDGSPVRTLGSDLMSSWALAFVVVKFDLEKGQEVEKVIPEGALTKEQEHEIKYMSFPDSNSHIVYDTCYVIKPKRASSKTRFNYGYVYFRQKQDRTLARGYIQHSLVLVSRWPFAGLLEQIVKQVSQQFFSLCPVSPTPVTCNVRSTSIVIQNEMGISYAAMGSRATSPAPGQLPSPHLATSPAPSCTSICFLSDIDQDEPDTIAALVSSTLAILSYTATTSTENLEPRYQLLRDTLLELSKWSHPEACGEYELPLLGGIVKWHAPRFTVTSKHATLNCSNRDVQDPKVKRHVGDLRARGKQQAETHQSTRLLDKLSGTRYVFGEVPLFSTFRSILRKLWRMWELSILGEPLCILSQSPTVSSSAVLAYVSLIHPITSCTDFRPYFSVQDSDFKEFTRVGKDVPFTYRGPVLGVTNPYFVKVLKHWPHFLSLNDHSVPGGAEAKRQREKDIMKKIHKGGGGKRRSTKERLLSDFKETFISERQYVVNDTTEQLKPVLQQLLVGNDATTDQVNTDILREHFLKLTDSFLRPMQACFEHLWSTLSSPPVSVSDPVFVKTFTPTAFKNYVRKHGYVKSIFKRDAKSVLLFYEGFVDGCHFGNWLEERVYEKYKQSLGELNVSELTVGMDETERIEILSRLWTDHNIEEKKVMRDPEILSRLQEHIDTILSDLPEYARKPVLRQHYRNALGSGAILPQWMQDMPVPNEPKQTGHEEEEEEEAVPTRRTPDNYTLQLSDAESSSESGELANYQ
eukprot:TRINITY_DN1676_c1_g1_i2.p1 TRINITY_DN1676_c1_g1~~TRINITY_DN1676_c1_g1_i2.p1  ORF type:complete len:802 (+),score=135.58 TRINITY_DN1676_c1_g1_i2:209-2614(+)